MNEKHILLAVDGSQNSLRAADYVGAVASGGPGFHIALVAVLVQSERFGTSVADALRTFAESMREFRSLRAQESAEKMAVRLLFPMVLLIFPALLIVLVGPAGMKIARMISSG